jgi:hypothetical protein
MIKLKQLKDIKMRLNQLTYPSKSSVEYLPSTNLVDEKNILSDIC